MSGSRIVGAVEIGTSKVVALVGEIVGNRSLSIIGKGQSSAQGIKKGEITDQRAAASCTHAALMAAEESAGVEISGVYLAASGRHVKGRYGSGVAHVSGHDSLVSEADVERAAQDAKSRRLPDNRIYIHHMRNHIALDGKTLADPVGAEGRQLEVGYWSVDGDERVIRNMIRIINGVDMQVHDLILSGIASARVSTSDEERNCGCLVIDIGCGTTDYTLYREGRVLRTGVLPVGGDHLTNDLAMGLRVNRKRAEDLKIESGKAMVDRADKQEKLWLIGDLTIGDRSIPRSTIYQILNCRVAEIFSIIRKELGPLLSRDMLPAGVILTGGSSRLPMICEAASRRLDLPVRLAEAPAWVNNSDLQGPEYSTVVGMVRLAFEDQRRLAEQRRPQAGLVRRLTRLFQT